MTYKKEGNKQQEPVKEKTVNEKIAEKMGWSMDKVESIKKIYDDMDLDSNGKVTFKEVKEKENFLAKFILKSTGISWGWNFAQLDDDKDGVLTFEEFVDLYKEDPNAV